MSRRKRSILRFILFAAVLLLAGPSAMAHFLHLYHGRVEAAKPRLDPQIDIATPRQVQLVQQAPPAAPPANTRPPMDPDHPVRLAIGWLGLPDEASNQRISDLIVANLGKDQNLELVDRQSLDAALREVQLSLAGVVRADSAVHVGKLLRADWFLLGTAAVIDGRNYLVERVVDARTGQDLDIQEFPLIQDTSQLTRDLAAFVRQCRMDASHPRPRTYLALGEFIDVNANNPHPELPSQMVSYLTAAFRGSTNVTLLEREHVDALLQELRLDLGGLTSEGQTNPPAPAQWAFWTVDGKYRFNRTGDADVAELVLTVWQIFNRSWDTTLNGPPGEPLFRQAKTAIDASLAKAVPPRHPPTRASEFALQMSTGKELCTFNLTALVNPYAVGQPYKAVDAGAMDEREHNLIRATRAFETAVLLEPDNLEAKIYLANCLCFIGKRAEAYNYFREAADAPAPPPAGVNTNSSATNRLNRGPLPQSVSRDDWKQIAMIDAALCYPNQSDAAERLRTAQRLNPARSNEYDVTFYRAKVAQNLVTPEDKLAWETLQGYQGLREGNGSGWPNVADYLKHYNSEPAEGLKKLTVTVADLNQKYPDFAPYLILEACRAMQETNNPFLAEFEQSIDLCSERADKVFDRGRYFAMLSLQGYKWCFDKGDFSLAVHIIEAQQKAFAKKTTELGVTDQLRLAYALSKSKRYQEALTVFTNLPPLPIQLAASGPWGYLGDFYLPGPDINHLQQRLGLPLHPDPRVANPVDKGVNFFTIAPFTCSDGSIWVAARSTLFQLDYNMNTNHIFEIAGEGARDLVVCAGQSKIWIGTAGGGLIEFDKTTHQSVAMTGRDGLYRNTISALYLHGDKLWIGFGDKGGLGWMDIQTHKLFTTAPPTTLTSAGLVGGGPQLDILGIAEDSAGQMFVTTGQAQFCSFSNNVLVRLPVFAEFGPIIGDGQHLVLSMMGFPSNDSSEWQSAPGSKNVNLAIRPGNGPWREIYTAAIFPNPKVESLAFDGPDVWLGGHGFVMRVYLGKMEVRKTLFIRETVAHMEIAGGYIWFQGAAGGGDLNTALLRIPLSVAKE